MTRSRSEAARAAWKIRKFRSVVDGSELAAMIANEPVTDYAGRVVAAEQPAPATQVPTETAIAYDRGVARGKIQGRIEAEKAADAELLAAFLAEYTMGRKLGSAASTLNWLMGDAIERFLIEHGVTQYGKR